MQRGGLGLVHVLTCVGRTSIKIVDCITATGVAVCECQLLCLPVPRQLHVCGCRKRGQHSFCHSCTHFRRPLFLWPERRCAPVCARSVNTDRLKRPRQCSFAKCSTASSSKPTTRLRESTANDKLRAFWVWYRWYSNHTLGRGAFNGAAQSL